MATAIPGALSGLGRALVQAGRLREADAEKLAGEGRGQPGGFIDALIASKRMTPGELALFAAETFGYPLLNLDAVDMDLLPAKALDRRLISTHRVIALNQRGNRIAIATADPTNMRALDDIRFQSGMAVDPVIVPIDQLMARVEKLSTTTEEALNNLVDEDVNFEFSDEEAETAADEAASTEVDDAPVVRFIQKTLYDAIRDGASDIHFEPYEKYYRIRYRIDGVLQEVAQPPLVIKEKIASRIKVISRLNIAEKRVPQDGRMKLVMAKNRAIDFRVSTLPCLHGEKIVLRILDPTSATLGVDALGYEPQDKKKLLWAVNRPYGMVLVTGPTGSGKTVSLYTCLNILNKPDINISTAEDPAEINLAGINQVNVDDRTGLTFAAALKSFLRQDPDVIMVGEIRDLETAEISVKAAQTGHLVLSTLHTNDAPTTLTRLMNMGVPSFNIASSIILITAQRLARRLCSCKQRIDDAPRQSLVEAGFTEEQLAGLGSEWHLYGPKGCDICKGGGYKGRVGIYQVMPVTEEIQRIIMSNGNALDIAAQAKRDGVKTLREAGIIKVMQGVTSLDEVINCTNE